VGVSICLLVLAGAALAFQLDPQREVERLNAKLTDRQPVTLIGDTGRPRWSAWRHGQEKSQVSIGADGCFSIHSWSFCLLELLADVPSEKYAVRMQVRHEKSNGPGDVGLYVAHRAHVGKQTRSHTFAYLTFNDIRDIGRDHAFAHLLGGYPRRLNAVQLDPCFQVDGTPGPYRASLMPGLIFDPARDARTWRELEIVVGPDGVEGLWEGERVGLLSAASIVAQIERWNEHWKQTRPDDPIDPPARPTPAQFDQRGGLGVYLYHGSASFRSFTVTPL
jgi:serine/threonine-protein kinase